AILAYLELQRGDLAAAEAHISQARTSLSSQDFYSFSPVLVADVAGQAALARGDYQQALAIAAEILTAQQRSGIQSFSFDLGHIQARALMGLGRMDEAGQLLADLSEQAEKQGALRTLWSFYALQADIAQRQNRPAAAHTLRQSAATIIAAIAGTFTNPALREGFLNQPAITLLFLKTQPSEPISSAPSPGGRGPG
ncbi:MAG: hypothetical protein ABI847_13660, partial [Anaerolineales bacterium]